MTRIPSSGAMAPRTIAQTATERLTEGLRGYANRLARFEQQQRQLPSAERRPPQSNAFLQTERARLMDQLAVIATRMEPSALLAELAHLSGVKPEQRAGLIAEIAAMAREKAHAMAALARSQPTHLQHVRQALTALAEHIERSRAG